MVIPGKALFRNEFRVDPWANTAPTPIPAKRVRVLRAQWSTSAPGTGPGRIDSDRG